jgi:hypothetical protein
MASPPLVLPGVLFVGEDDRARIVAHTGPAAGWHVPRGILGWSTEVSVVGRDALTEEIRRATKLVMPEEQIPPARMPLTAQAAQKSPLVAVSSRLAPKLVESGVRVHTVGVDRVTSSFYYLAEGGGEDQIRIEGDLVQSVGTMLGERADNAAIERVLDGLPDRLLRALSKDRVSELTMELAALLPRAAADGSGMGEIDLEAFEKALSALIASGEKYAKVAQEIATKLAETNERRVEVPLFGEARKISQGPFDITVGERRVALPTYERWVMTSAPSAEAAKQVAAAAGPAAVRKRLDSQDSMLANLETAPVDPAKAAEAAKAAQAARAAEAAKAAEAARAAEAAKTAEAARRKAEEAKKAEEAAAKAAEQAKQAEEAAAKAAEEAKRAEEAAAKAAEEAKQAEEAAAAKAAEEAKAAEAAAAAKAAEEAKAAEAAAAKAAAAKAAEAASTAEEAKKAGGKKGAGKKGGAKKGGAEAKRADGDSKQVAMTATDDEKSSSTTVKTRRPEKSSSMAWIFVLVLVAAGVAAWRFYFHK